MSGRSPKRTTIPPGTSLLEMMASGEGFGSVPLEEIPPPPPGSIGELFAMVEERSAELRRLAELEPNLIRARKMLDGRNILRERADAWQKILGYSMIEFCSQAEGRKIDNLARLVHDTCAAMYLAEKRSYLEGIIGPVAFANFEKYSKGHITDDGLRKAGQKALAAIGMTWKELRAKLLSGEPIDETDDKTG